MNRNSFFYAENAETLREQYNSVSFEKVHADWLGMIPSSGYALDIGAGTGRDALALAERGFRVKAIEPVSEMLLQGQLLTANNEVEWLRDSLPGLSSLQWLDQQFDLILVSAVWMHLNIQERKDSIHRLESFLTPNGILVITLRHGQFNDDRISIPCSVDELVTLASANCLSVSMATELSNDGLGRLGVAWQTVVLKKQVEL